MIFTEQQQITDETRLHKNRCFEAKNTKLPFQRKHFPLKHLVWSLHKISNYQHKLDQPQPMYAMSKQPQHVPSTNFQIILTYADAVHCKMRSCRLERYMKFYKIELSFPCMSLMPKSKVTFQDLFLSTLFYFTTDG